MEACGLRPSPHPISPVPPVMERDFLRDGREADDFSELEEGMVQVNQDIETRRGRQLHDGDVITYNGTSLVIRAQS